MGFQLISSIGKLSSKCKEKTLADWETTIFEAREVRENCVKMSHNAKHLNGRGKMAQRCISNMWLGGGYVSLPLIIWPQFFRVNTRCSFCSSLLLTGLVENCSHSFTSKHLPHAFQWDLRSWPDLWPARLTRPFLVPQQHRRWSSSYVTESPTWDPTWCKHCW